MLRKPPAQRQGMLRQMNKWLLPVLEKGLVSPSLIHKVLAEYLDVAGPGTKVRSIHWSPYDPVRVVNADP
jgi:pumilio family protein 6